MIPGATEMRKTCIGMLPYNEDGWNKLEFDLDRMIRTCLSLQAGVAALKENEDRIAAETRARTAQVIVATAVEYTRAHIALDDVKHDHEDRDASYANRLATARLDFNRARHEHRNALRDAAEAEARMNDPDAWDDYPEEQS